MSKQRTDIPLTNEQKRILKLEHDYFEKLKGILTSDKFQEDLRLIETEIKLNYSKLASIWKKKNKLNVAAERLVRHHIYKNMMDEIEGVYESPLSSDVGIEFKDCILCVDCKTLDTVDNINDINYTIVEPNQISFDNSSHPYIKAESHLETHARRNRLPVLTYIIKIIYRDDKVRFDISRTTTDDKKPSIVLVCIPNGELSNLFDKDLIFNFKTYKYYSKNDGERYACVTVPKDVENPNLWVEEYCTQKGYLKKTIPQNRGTKDIYFDAENQCCWTYTKDDGVKMIRAIMRGDTMRIKNPDLEERYNSVGERWDGYIYLDI